MAEEIKQTEKKEESKTIVETKKIEEVSKENKMEEIKEVVKADADNKEKVEKDESKKDKEKSKKKEEKIPKKEEAVVNGSSLHASKKHCMYICAFIMNKTVDKAIADLEDVIKFKRPIPFKGEIPHRKGKGMMSGRYPIKVSKMFISLLKGLKGNLIVNGLDPDSARIFIASPSWASRPMKSGGARFKRTHVILKAKEFKDTGEKK